METILLKCVKIKNLPEDCTQSTLEVILQMAPGEDRQLDKKIEKLHNLAADARIILFNTNEDAEQCLNKGEWVFETTGNGAFLISPSRPNMHEVPTDWVNIQEPLVQSQPVPLPGEHESRQRTSSTTVDYRHEAATNVIVILNQADDSSKIEAFVSGPPAGASVKEPDDTGNMYMELTESDESNRKFGEDMPNQKINEVPVRTPSPDRNRGRPPVAPRRTPPPIPPRRPISTNSYLSKSPRQSIVNDAPPAMNIYELLKHMKRFSLVSDGDIEDVSYRPIEKETLFLCQSRKDAEQCLNKGEWVFETTGNGAFLISPSRPNMHEVPTDWVNIQEPLVQSQPVPLPGEHESRQRTSSTTVDYRHEAATNVIVILNQADDSSKIEAFVSGPPAGASVKEPDDTGNMYMELTESDESNRKFGEDMPNQKINEVPVRTPSPDRNRGRPPVAPRRTPPPIPPRRPISTNSYLSKSPRQIIVNEAPPAMNTYELLKHMKRFSLVSDGDIEDVSYRPIEKETLFLCQSRKDAEQCLNKGEWVFETTGNGAFLISPSRPNMHEVPTDWVNIQEPLVQSQPVPLPGEHESRQRTSSTTVDYRHEAATNVIVILNQADDSSKIEAFVSGPPAGASVKEPDDTDNVYMELIESEWSSRKFGEDMPNQKINEVPVRTPSPDRHRGRPPVAPRRKPPPIPPRRPISTDSYLSKSRRQIIVKGAPPEMNTYELLKHMKRFSLVSDGDIEDVSYRPIEKETLFLCQSRKVAEYVTRAVNENNQSIIEGSTLTAVLHENYPYDIHKLLFTGYSETFTKEDISHEIRLIMGHNPTDVSVAQSHAAALVSFDIVIDTFQIESLNEKCLERNFPFRFSPVPKTNCIKVSCFGTVLEDNALKYYFDHLETSCEEGNIIDIVHEKHLNVIIISFRDGYDSEAVCQKEVHVIEDHEVHIAMYYPCLEVQVILPPPFLYPLSQYIRRFIQRSVHYKKDLMDILAKDEAKLQWPSLMDPVEYIEIKCSMAFTDLQDDSRLSKWKYDCTSTLNDICKRWCKRSIYVAEEAWTKVKTRVKVGTSDEAYIEYIEQDYTIVISGEVAKVKALASKIQATASSIEITYPTLRKRFGLKKHELDILKMNGASSTFRKSLTVKELDSCLVLEGPNEDIIAAMKSVSNVLKTCYNQVYHGDCELSKQLISCSETLDYINQKLQEEHLSCVFAEILGQLRVFGKNEDETSKVVTSVNRLLKSENFSLDKKMRNRFTDNDKDDFLVKLEHKYKGQMKYKLCSKRLTILCVDKVFERICEAIALFIDLHSDFFVFLNIEPGTLQWIDRNHKSDIDDVIERFKVPPDPLKITKFEKRIKSGFSFSGIKIRCREAMLSVVEISDKVIRKDHFVMWSNFDKFLSGTYGVNHLTECEEKTKCVIKCSNDKLKADMNPNPTIAEFKLQTCSIKLTCCNLTEMKADYLVHPTSATLSFTSELSLEILREGGTSIHDECEKGTKSPRHIIVTSAGLLPCKGIMHVILDKWSVDCPDKEKALRNVITSCMREADNLNCNSLAFPVICSDQFCLPVDVIAKNMLSAIRNFWREVGLETNVNNVYICDVNESLLTSIASKSKEFFPRTKATTAVNEPCGGTPEHNDGIRPCIVQGNIELQEADVIVNVTNKQMDLQSAGTVSKQLVNIGGKSILTDCRTKYPNGISVGDIARTSGGRLKCKQLFHGVLSPWDEGQGVAEMVLRCFVSKCLRVANALQYNSIAFPALGTGYLGFPAGVTAKIMFEEVLKFGNEIPKSNLTDVRFVIFAGSANHVLGAFEKYKNETARSSKHLDVPLSLESFIVNKNGYTGTIDRVTLYVHHGDITTVPTTAFVNVTSDKLCLESGNISRRVLAAAGKCIQHEGCVGISTDKIVKIMLESFNDFFCGPEYKTYLRTIKLVVYEKNDLDVIISEMMKFFSPGKQQTVLSFKGKDDKGEAHRKQKQTFHIHGDLIENINEAIKLLDDLEIQEAIVLPRMGIKRPSISKKIEELTKIGYENGVDIVHSPLKDRILISGYGKPAKVILENFQQEIDYVSNI